ncbi:unnamed protein product [Scytosiphon promiscuus]
MRARSSLLALALLVLSAPSASVADGSLGGRVAAGGSPAIGSAWARRRNSQPSVVDSRGGSRHALSFDKVVRLRGGVKRASAVKADEEDEDADDTDLEESGTGALSALAGIFKNMPPATRVYVLLLMLITAVDVSVGKVIDSGNTFSLDWGRTGLELWRPFTSLIYLGPLSMQWLTNVYFLTQHGTRLEHDSGTAEQVIFLLVVGSLLLLVGPLLGMPFMSTSMVAAHTHVSARMDPLGVAQFQFLRIPTWTMPFAQAGAAVLQAEGDPLAAIPTLVGIFCGHVYHFFTVVHPLMGAKRRLGAPAWMKRRLDGVDNPNFMETPDEPAAPRGRKIGAGKKKASKSKAPPKKGLGSSKKGMSKARPTPEFPTADGGGCS